MEKNTFKPLNESNKNKFNEENALFKNVVRGPFYLCGFVLLLFVTSMIFIALFTNNWRKTVNIQQEWYTEGIWFSCRFIRPSWLKNVQDIYCATFNFSQNKWIHAVQVFYTISAALNLYSLFASLFGLCRDCGRTTLAIPSMVMWTLLVSTLFQLISISVYGGKGIGDYSIFEPDYSIIIASVALSLNSFCVILFLIEILTKSLRKNDVNSVSYNSRSKY